MNSCKALLSPFQVISKKEQCSFRAYLPQCSQKEAISIFPSFCNYRGIKCRPTLVTASSTANCDFRIFP